MKSIEFEAGGRRYRIEYLKGGTFSSPFAVFQNGKDMGQDADGASLCEDDILTHLFVLAEQNQALRENAKEIFARQRAGLDAIREALRKAGALGIAVELDKKAIEANLNVAGLMGGGL